MGLDHRLDSWSARAPVDSRDRALVLHEDERRNVGDSKSTNEFGAGVGVDAGDAKPVALCARQMREEALHPARGTGAPIREEDQQGPGVIYQGFSQFDLGMPFFPANRADKPRP